MATFGERLKELMNEGQLTSAELGKQIGYAPSGICRWYNYNKDISLDTLITLSDYFQCSLEYLAGRMETDTPYTYRKLLPFAIRLPHIMKEMGVTSYRMIKDEVFSPAVYHYWQHGSCPRLSSLIKIANYLQCTLDHLVGR